MRFAAIVDHPQRDLLGLSLVSAHVATMGHQLDLISADSAGRQLVRGDFDLVLVNYVRDNNRRLLHRILDGGQKVVVLDTEGGVFETPAHFERTLSTDRELFARLSSYLTWGTQTRDLLVREGFMSADRVIITGQPRFDVYRPPYLEAMRSVATNRTHKTRPRLLVNFNYPIARPRFGTAESEVRALVERMSWPKDEATRLQRRQADARIEMLSLVDLLASRIPTIEIAVRPHPFESVDDLLELTRRRDNVVFAGNSPIQDWIVSSDLVLQRGCTTAIEAWLAGSLAVSPTWVDADRGENIADKMSFEVDGRSDLVEICESLGRDGFLPRAAVAFEPTETHVEKVVGWVGLCDGRSAWRVATTLEQIGRQSQMRKRRRRGPSEIMRSAVPARIKRVGRTKRLSTLWDNAKMVRKSLILRDAPVVAVISDGLKLSRQRPFHWRSAEDLRSDIPKSSLAN
jgi:surface carbohydrate biosynthesis protein